MRPFTGVVMLPGCKREMWTETRLFFDLYWQLLWLGYTEDQLADHVIRKRWETKPPMPEAIAFVKAVYDLADHKNLMPSSAFFPHTKGNHPRQIVDHFK